MQCDQGPDSTDTASAHQSTISTVTKLQVVCRSRLTPAQGQQVTCSKSWPVTQRQRMQCRCDHVFGRMMMSQTDMRVHRSARRRRKSSATKRHMASMHTAATMLVDTYAASLSLRACTVVRGIACAGLLFWHSGDQVAVPHQDGMVDIHPTSTLRLLALSFASAAKLSRVRWQTPASGA
jgi:hypothetical protein